MPAGLIFDDSPHYVDHLAPFCALHGWPLIVCESGIADLVRRYYPKVEVIEMDLRDLHLPATVVSCSPRPAIEMWVRPDPSRQFLWLPHGNSDKGWKSLFFEPLQGEIALVYGQRMIDFMHQKNIFPKTIRVGNFRLQYWIENRIFYDPLLEKRAGKTVLYAPTWDDSEGNGSFWEMLPRLIASLREGCNLIVKPHPNTLKKQAPEIERLIGQYAKNQSLSFLTEFTPIYPLLNVCDLYIGDMSSIGYDFLYFKRPMFFLKCTDRSHFLYRCGQEISLENIDNIFQSRAVDKKEIQQEVYNYTFDAYSPLSDGRIKTNFKSFRVGAVG